MSLAMHRGGIYASSNLSRGANGAVKATNVPSYSTLGTSSSSSYKVNSSRITQQGQSTAGRVLPHGPGPLPNRTTLEKGKVKFVASSSNRTSHVASPKSTAKESQTARRKSSNDSGYGSSEKESSFTSNHRYSYLSDQRWKSLSHLSGMDETNDLSYRRSRTDSYSNLAAEYRAAYIQKTGHLNAQRSIGHDHVSSKHTNNTGSGSSTYRSTTHSDYKDPKEDSRTAVTNSKVGRSRSYSLDKDNLSNGYTSKSSYNVIDVGKVRKSTITATPTDLKCSRKSSLTLSTSSSNNSSPSPTSRGNSDGLVGLRNLGNTCFMNSILQCLSHTPLLTEHLLRGLHTKNINSNSSMKGKLIQAFAELIKSMWKPGSSDVVSPHTFKTQIQRFAPRFVGYNQQDAQEFLRFLLEGLHDDLNQVRSKPKYTLCEFDNKFSHKENAEKSWKNYLSRDNSLMTDLFVGQLKSMLTCCTCDNKSVTFDPFWDLSLPIPRKSGSSSHSGRRSSGTDDGVIDIRDCMLSFTKEEILDGDERPTCDKCKVKRKSTKKFSIQRLPPILVLHLKRFSGFSFRSKLQSNVDFPMRLDLAEFSADPQERRSAEYSLYAVSNHSGSTYGGHYTAYCKHPVSNEWHCFNDSRVDPLLSSKVRGSQAYILFYEKAGTKSSL